MNILYRIVWPSFLVAGIAEVVFFLVIDPRTLYLFGEPVTLSPIATYSTGFFFFWAICAGSCMATQFLQYSAVEVNQSRYARQQRCCQQVAEEESTPTNPSA